MKKVIVTLRDAPSASLEVPAEFPRRRRRGDKAESRKIERSVFGAIRLFPGVPKSISAEELEYLRLHRPDVHRRLDVRAYIESKRMDRRGASEGQIEDLAAKEGIGHLEFREKVARLGDRGKIPKARPRKSRVGGIPEKTERTEKAARKPK